MIGNCNVCHTKSDGMPYAGGRPLQTPFGTIYATNITPDPETGIGGWSEAAFLRAMREGRAPGRRSPLSCISLRPLHQGVTTTICAPSTPS